MGYKIAVVSSDGKNVDLCFGKAVEFMIYEAENKNYRFLEKRPVVKEQSVSGQARKGCRTGACGMASEDGKQEISLKVKQISDCRIIVCKKMGFQVQKQLERQSVASFDITCSVAEALEKITAYFAKVDNCQSLRRAMRE